MATSQKDWQAAYAQIVVRRREQLGPPPTPGEVIALYEGELADEEAERIEKLLAYYPELAIPSDEEFALDDPPVLTPEQIAEDLAAIRKRVREMKY